MNQEILQFLEETMNITEENNERVTNFQAALVSDYSNFFPLCEIAANHQNQSISHAAIIYISQILKSIIDTWSEIDENTHGHVLQSILQLLQSNISETALHTLLASVITLYGELKGEWPELIQLIMQMIVSNSILRGLEILNSIFLIIPDNVYSEICGNFPQLSLNALNSEDIKLKYQGADLITSFIKKHQDQHPSFPEHCQLILNLAANSKQLQIDDFSNFWGNVNILVYLHSFTQEQVVEIANIVFQFADDPSFSQEIVSAALRSIIPALNMLGDEAAGKLLDASINICAKTIELDEAIPNDQLQEVEDIIHNFNHQAIYPLIRNVVQVKISSNDLSQQIASLLVFSVILTEAKDCAFVDIEPILDFIRSALSAEDTPLLQQAALTCVSKFDDTFAAMNTQSSQFLEVAIGLCKSPNSGVRKIAYEAAHTIMNQLDHEIPGLYTTVASLSETLDTPIDDVDEDQVEEVMIQRWSDFLTLLSPAIDLTEDLVDEQVDEILGLVEKIINEHEDDPSFIGPLLDVGVAVMKKDETQAETVLGMLAPCAEMMFKAEDQPDLVFHVDGFLRNIALTIGDGCAEFVQPYLERLFQHLETKQHEKILTGAIEALAAISTSVPSLKDAIRNPLMEHLVPAFSADSEDGLVVTTAMEAARALKKEFTPELQALVFEKVFEVATEDSDDADNIGDAFLTLSKIIKYSHDVNREMMVAKCTELAQSLADASLPFLGGVQLIEHPSFSVVARPVEHFLAALLRFPIPESDAICRFLLSWPIETAAFEADDIAGAYTEAIKTGAISEEVRQAIFASVARMFENCYDPGVQQNLVFFLITIIRANHENAQQVIQFLETIDIWYRKGKNDVYGYQDTLANIAALYLEIANIHSDFPQELVLQAVDEFPPSDALEAVPMSKCILNITQKYSQNPDVILHVALALARFVVWDDKSFEKSKMDDALRNQLHSLFKTIVMQNQNLMGALQSNYGKQRAKFRKLCAVLN